MRDEQLHLWTVYKKPRDYPESYVVRRSVVFCGAHPLAGQVAMDSQPTAVVSSLEDARAHVPPGRYCLPRYLEDDPCIVEVWL
jgi:hypothetical protein